jgi:hypothetical protein
MGHEQWSRRTRRSTSQEETEFLAGTTESRRRENASDVGEEKEGSEESSEELGLSDAVRSNLADKSHGAVGFAAFDLFRVVFR